MSVKVFERLAKMMIETTHEERADIDKEIEEKKGKYCDDAVDDLSDTEFIEIVNKVKRKRKKQKKMEVKMEAAYA